MWAIIDQNWTRPVIELVNFCCMCSSLSFSFSPGSWFEGNTRSSKLQQAILSSRCCGVTPGQVFLTVLLYTLTGVSVKNRKSSFQKTKFKIRFPSQPPPKPREAACWKHTAAQARGQVDPHTSWPYLLWQAESERLKVKRFPFGWSPPETKASSYVPAGTWQSRGERQASRCLRDDSRHYFREGIMNAGVFWYYSCFSATKGIRGPDQGCSVGDKSQKTRSESHALILSPSLLTSRHSASSSASHIPPLRRKELRWCSISSSSEKVGEKKLQEKLKVRVTQTHLAVWPLQYRRIFLNDTWAICFTIWWFTRLHWKATLA